MMLVNVGFILVVRYFFGNDVNEEKIKDLVNLLSFLYFCFNIVFIRSCCSIFDMVSVNRKG